MKKRTIKTKGRGSAAQKVVYKTPGRECAHADRGCCPKCIDPCRLLGNKLKK